MGSGIPSADAPTIRADLGFTYAEASWLLLAFPLLLSFFLETPLLLLSDRWPRRRLVPIGLAAMAVSLFVAATAQSPFVLAAALALWASAGGVGVDVAQGALMNAYPNERERMMTRWTLMGELGDACAPLLILGAAVAGYNWRVALGLAAVLHLVLAAVIMFSRFPEAEPTQEDEPDQDSLWTRLKQGLNDRELLVWLGGESLCCLLDEILVVFGTMFLRDELDATIYEQGAFVLVAALGGALGLAVTDRLLKHVAPVRLLLVSALACAASFALWLSMTSVAWSIAVMFVVGFTCGPLYPIAKAQAYRAVPNRPGLVAAVSGIYGPIPVLAPALVGYLADHYGLSIALTILALQPIGLAILAAAKQRC